MSSVAQHLIREPSTGNVRQYHLRTYRLAAAYFGLCALSCVGIALIVWKAQFYVTLSQRSNVETLTLAFLLIFFVYLVIISIGGALGALHVLYYFVLGRIIRDKVDLEQRKARALGPPIHSPATVGLNYVLELEYQPGEPFSIPIKDRAGSMGTIYVHGAEVTHFEAHRDGSDTFVAFFVEQANHILHTRGAPANLNIVEWKKVSDESADEYINMVRFAQNLERQLGAKELWPKRLLCEADRAELERRLSQACAALRDEGFLPHWEYEGEHKVPLIPEPLGFISLSRTEKRVDPVSSMGCAVFIVAALVIALAFIIAFPPWVPS